MTSPAEMRPLQRVRSRFRGGSSRPRARLSIQGVSTVWAVVFGLVSLVVIAGLVWTADLLQRATDDVIRDTTSMTLASEIELRLLEYHRLSVLYQPYNADVVVGRAEIGRALELLIAEADKHVAAAPESATLKQIATSVEDYREKRERLEAEGLEPRVIRQAVLPELELALSQVEAFRQMNEDAVREAQVETLRVDRLANVAAAAAGALLLIGLIVVVVFVRRYITGPVLELHRTIRRFRAGETDVRAPARGSRELADVAEAFNAMIEALVRERDARLAFTAGVVHDLRNPLSALRMGVDLAKADTSEKSRARVLVMVDRQVGRLARMVDDLLDATRIEAGKLELNKRPIDLREAAYEMVDLYAPGAPNHEIVLSLEDEIVCVDADPLRIEQVASNLVSNAIKYSPDGGRVDVIVRRLEREAVLEVRDQGVGISEERMGELFTPFRRLATEVAPGVGLGLSVVRRIVQAHGGTIEVESEVRKGSTFRVRLPLARSEST